MMWLCVSDCLPAWKVDEDWAYYHSNHYYYHPDHIHHDHYIPINTNCYHTQR